MHGAIPYSTPEKKRIAAIAFQAPGLKEAVSTSIINHYRQRPRHYDRKESLPTITTNMSMGGGGGPPKGSKSPPPNSNPCSCL